MRNKNKKKLRLNKRTIQNLSHNHVNILGKYEQKVITAGSIPIFPVDVGTTRHPKYC
jgi:hypothetical protein